MKHFEDLWVECEEFNKKESNSIPFEELLLKVNLYKMISEKVNIPPDELQKIKSRTLGEILLVLTGLSLTDNIDAFSALQSALQYKSSAIEQMKD